MSNASPMQAPSRGVRLFLAWIVGSLLIASATPALAHRPATGAGGPEGAIAIPNLSHGQMRVIADYRSEVMELAAEQAPTDPTMRRLETFINLQRFACIWGIMPGSVSDEDSPFNECAHAYLAATRALLVHLQSMPGNKGKKLSLVRSVELAMLDNGASLVLCRYSDEPFNTAEVIAPHWREIPAHAPSCLALAGTAVTMLGCTVLARRRGREASGLPG